MAYYGSLRNQYLYPKGDTKPGQCGWVTKRLLRLRAMLNGEITSKRLPNSLIIGSWNIRHFDGGRERLPESFHYIAEIIDHFDICAIQEVKNIDAMKKLMKLLGPNWDYFINDSSGGGRGNHERMAFVFNKNKVSFRHLIGELVLPKGSLPGDEQIARTPFFASFQASWFKFTLCSAHIVFDETAGRPLREDEIGVIAKTLSKRAKKMDEVHVFLGDMNIKARDDAGMKALEDNGFSVPDIGTTDLNGSKHYDQIAFTGPADESHRLSHGIINWQEVVFTKDEMADYEQVAMEIRTGKDAGKPYANWPKEYKSWRTHEMSDHLPIWIEIKTDYSNEYLRRLGSA
ncbi:MAG: endonuclease/exonuclease/phosphatase family protein [Maricaulaceae bacterium]